MSLHREMVNIYILTTKEALIVKYQKRSMDVITYPADLRNMLVGHLVIEVKWANLSKISTIIIHPIGNMI